MSSRAAARCRASPSRRRSELACRAAAAVGADFAGVDLIDGADGAADWCSRSTACRPGRACRRSPPSTSRRRWRRAFWRAALIGRRATRAGRAMSDGARADRRRLFRAACRAELEAPKPGNVHVFAAGHGMDGGRFRAQRRGRAPARSPSRGARVGARILGAVEATHAAVGMNTNLGIVLLCAPLAAAAESAARRLCATRCATCSTDLDRRGRATCFRGHRARRARRASDTRPSTTCASPRGHAARGHGAGGATATASRGIRHRLSRTSSRRAAALLERGADARS